MVWTGVDAVLVADMGPRVVLPVVYIPVVRNMAVLAQRLSLYRFVMLLRGQPKLR